MLNGRPSSGPGGCKTGKKEWGGKGRGRRQSSVQPSGSVLVHEKTTADSISKERITCLKVPKARLVPISSPWGRPDSARARMLAVRPIDGMR
eukprot:2531161-Rhodomonas_salina.2